MKKRMHHFLGIALTTLGSCHLEGEAHAAPFFIDKERGWFWREVEPEPIKKKTNLEARQKVIASPPPTKEAPPAPLSVSWLRKHLGIYRDKAIDDPSPENIAAYFYLQRVMMDKAHRFTDVAHEVVLSDPELDENTRRPIATFGAQEANRLATRTSDESLSLIAQSTGILFFFRSDCSYCHLQAPLLRILEERYGFKVFAVSLDGMAMPGDLYQDFTIDQGQAARLGIQSTPALFLLNPPAKVIPLLPIFADWPGTGTPTLNLVSRTGQLMSFSLFDSGSNYNACIAAQSGSGKSFLTNELIVSSLAEGARVWVIDVGRSYMNLAESLEGEFMAFNPESNLCINPFDLIQNWEEEADVIAGLVTSMAAPTEKLSDFQSASLKRILRDVWEEKGKAMTVDEVAQKLKAESDQRIIDLGEQLFPFTQRGEYGRFFHGRNTVRFRGDLTVLELEELKGRKHLQQVVLLQLIYQIQQAMYLGERDRPKIVIIDESWDLLTLGDAATFMEHGYRRFRKYGGSAITITQSVNDLYRTPTGRAIVENSAHMILLGQKAEAVEALKSEKRLPLPEGGYTLLKTVHTVPGVYSELFLLTERGSGIGRLIVDPFKRLLFSTKPDEVHALKRLRQEGRTLTQAIHHLQHQRSPHHGPSAL
ncbi:MAG: DUF87 domain-containing protein [Gammaproteobacteria bacterium]|nr:DUF87 domain-containing protein [Gammaproteobacteria bacterium]NBT45589.1 DUF87 domain-containing protein [Gammaproteobacteria bacterium]NBY23052.1 DUF87 domain-containing protein [Gammaproteobacteria bacterium]